MGMGVTSSFANLESTLEEDQIVNAATGLLNGEQQPLWDAIILLLSHRAGVLLMDRNACIKSLGDRSST
jgi:hypothetical protein